MEKFYIYTSENCPKCHKQIAEWKSQGIQFEERSADRIKILEDEIDREALIQASMQNMELPVIVII